MEKNYTEDKTFENIDYTKTRLAKGDYEYCRFINCDFSNSDVSDISFIDCEFHTCNLSVANLAMSVLRDIKFVDCKMLGIHFENCNQFGLAVKFENCNLAHSSFYQTKLKKTPFKNCNLGEVDFTECDISNSIFETCDFTKAKFENTILEKADLRTAFNYSIDPEINKIKKAKFSLDGITGLLNKYDIDIEMILK